MLVTVVVLVAVVVSGSTSCSSGCGGGCSGVWRTEQGYTGRMSKQAHVSFNATLCCR